MSTSDAIKLVVSDVDGTLLTSRKELTSAAKNAIQELGQAGVGFTVTSGRPPLGMLELLSQLNLKIPVAAFNGGMFFDPEALPEIKVVSEKLLPEEVSRQVVEQLLQDGHDVWVYRGLDWYILNTDSPHVKKEIDTVKFQPKLVKSFEGYFDRVVKIVGVSDQKQKLEDSSQTIADHFKSKVSSVLSQPYYLDVTHPEANKGEVVRFLAHLRHLSTSQIATLGDMPNDISMFKVSGLSIAMGNSNEHVKSEAKEVTDSLDNEGFAHAIKKFVLTAVS